MKKCKRILAILISIMLMMQTVVVLGDNTPLFAADFTGYEGGTTIHDEMIAIDGAGYLNAITIDEEHDTSLKLGRATTDDGSGDTYIGIPINTSAKRKVSFSFNMNSESTGGQAYDINLRGSNGKVAYIGIIQDGNIVLLSKDDGVTAGATIPYEAGQWYKLDLIVDGANYTYTFILTKPDGSKVSVPGTLRSAMGTSMNVFRVFAPGRVPTSDTYIAIDDIIVVEPQGPQLAIAGVSEGIIYSSEALPTIDVTATDDSAVTKIEVFVDGSSVNSVQADRLNYTLTGLAAGPHTVKVVATDDEGLTTEQTVNMYVDAYFAINFTGYEGGTAIHDEMIAIDGAGYLDAITIDEEHGTSLKLGRGTTDDGSGDTYIGIPVNTSEKRKVSFAFNMNSESTGGQSYDINLRDSGGKAAYIGIIQDGNIVLMSKDDGVTAGATIPYEAGKWYKLDLIVEGINRAYTFILTKPDGTKVTVPGTLRSGMGTNINLYRIFAPGYTPAAETYIAIDDISVGEPSKDVLPELTVAGISEGVIYSSASLPTIDVTATDDRAVTKIEVFVDGTSVNSVQADRLNYTLTGLAAGPHTIKVVATDDEGLKAEKNINIYVDAIFAESFTDCASASDSQLGLVEGGKGYFEIATIDSAHGESLKIGYSSASTGAEADCYAMLSLGTTASREVSFNVYMSSENTGGKEYYLQLRTVDGSASARQVMGYIKDGYIYLQSDNAGTIGAKIPYIAEQWYKITYTVAPAGRVYEITVTKPDGTKAHMTGENRSSMKRKADRLEFYAPNNASADSYIAIDDITVKEYNSNVGGLYNVAVSGSNKTYNCSFKMKYSDNTSGVYVVALYNNSKLVGTKLINMDTAATTYESAVQTITTTDDATTYKVMFVNDMNVLTPICIAAIGNVVNN